MLIEVIGLNVDDVIDAEKSGADRIELCQSIAEDGLTPSYGLIKSAVEAVEIPIHVMVRPHNQSFVYSSNDLYTMCEDIKIINELGAAGIVIGPLTEEGQIDEQALQYLLNAAQGLQVTFHRAFDFAINQQEALETILQYKQITTILTSGGGRSALDQSDRLKELIDITKGSHLTIMPGSGLRVEGLKEFYSDVRPKALHFGTGVRENYQYEKSISYSKVKRIREVTMLNKYPKLGEINMTVDTPTLMLDVDKLENNIKEVVQFAEQHAVAYRPHIKTHKCIEIAKRQINYGAIGVTVATVGEAEVMASAGIKDILIAYPISQQAKLEHIVALLDKAKITVTVDSSEQATLLNEFFTKHNITLNVWIKVNSGLNRCGVEPNEEVVELAKHIQGLSALMLGGIFTHAGHSYASTPGEELEKIARYEAEAIVTSANLCEAAGIPISHRSIGSTPTYKIAGAVKGITEIRPGNVVFNDMIQVGLGVATIDQCALTVLASVGSIKSGRIVIDAGSKTLNLDRGAHGNEIVVGHGYIKEYPHLFIDRLSEEHGIIKLENEENIPALGEIITIIPNHACTVANLFPTYHVHRNGRIIDEWEVDARGRVD